MLVHVVKMGEIVIGEKIVITELWNKEHMNKVEDEGEGGRKGRKDEDEQNEVEGEDEKMEIKNKK